MIIRRHAKPHHPSFRAWVLKCYGRPYEPRVIFRKYDQEIWHIVGRAPEWATMEDVTEWYAAMIETAASRLMSSAAKSSGEAY